MHHFFLLVLESMFGCGGIGGGVEKGACEGVRLCVYYFERTKLFYLHLFDLVPRSSNSRGDKIKSNKKGMIYGKKRK